MLLRGRCCSSVELELTLFDVVVGTGGGAGVGCDGIPEARLANATAALASKLAKEVDEIGIIVFPEGEGFVDVFKFKELLALVLVVFVVLVALELLLFPFPSCDL